MNMAGCKPQDRSVVPLAEEKQAQTGAPAMAIQLADGRTVTGKTSALLGPASAALMNALKLAAGIDDDEQLVSASAIEPIQTLKTKYLGGRNPRLHTDETLIALSVSASNNAHARLAMEQLPALRGAQAHATALMSAVDENLFRKLGISLTCSPVFE
jgi:uncharacterized protein (UPF0371 family)